MPIVEASAGIVRAATELQAGRLVAFPTETVYGLGADATNGRAVAQIFEAKGRPRFNPLIVHVADRAAAELIARFTAKARRLAEAFWPGPLTLVLPRRPEARISELVSAGLDSIAIRVPAHPVAQALLRAAGLPVAAPSANVSGHVSPTTARHVEADLGAKAAMILDGGPTELGLESTVLDATGERIVMLRPGATTREAIEAVLGEPVGGGGRSTETGVADADVPPAQLRSPGQLESHYAPRARVRLGATDLRPGEVLLAFGTPFPGAEEELANLSPSGDLIEAAANLFAALRRLDATGAETIAVMPIPESGLGEAINDRLRRAAAGR
ncbi:MAG: threonylcarbamoyl-AMP synthase [Hyphomicrobiaceae bacterium]|nr:threonylcarbamoyl-AMP synthase [Hyphomicrobiaceae bacterium]